MRVCLRLEEHQYKFVVSIRYHRLVAVWSGKASSLFLKMMLKFNKLTKSTILLRCLCKHLNRGFNLLKNLLLRINYLKSTINFY